MDRDALQRKIEALAGDVRAQASHRDRQARPDDARTEYAAFVLPAGESGQKPDLLKVVIGLGVDPRADPTVMASRIRDSMQHAFTGNPRKARWHAITALGLIGSAVVIGAAFLHPGAMPAGDSMQAGPAHASLDATAASPGGQSPSGVPAATASVDPVQAVPAEAPAAKASAQALPEPKRMDPKKKPSKAFAPRRPRNAPIGRGPEY